MIMLKCDRCGKVSQIKTPNFFLFQTSKESGDFEQSPRYLVMKDYAQINLCSECEKDLDDFLDGREVREVEEVRNVENCKNCFYFNSPCYCFAQKNMSSVKEHEAETCDYFITKEEFWSNKWELKK